MRLLKFYVGIMVGIFLSLVGCQRTNPDERREAVVSCLSHQPRLYTVQYNIHKILTYEDVSMLEGTLFGEKISIPIPGDRKIALPVDATIKAYVEFDDFTMDHVVIEGNQIVLQLKEPRLEMTSAVIDYDHEKEYLSWNRSKFSEAEKESLLRVGKKKILQEMRRSDVMDRSRKSAYAAISPILKAGGWDPEHITIRFRNECDSSGEGESVWDLLQDKLSL